MVNFQLEVLCHLLLDSRHFQFDSWLLDQAKNHLMKASLRMGSDVVEFGMADMCRDLIAFLKRIRRVVFVLF
jgi:hypothetical protein